VRILLVAAALTLVAAPPAAGSAWRTQSLGGAVGSADVAFTPAGDAAIVWRDDTNYRETLRFSIRRGRGTFSAARLVPGAPIEPAASPQAANDPRVAVDARGRTAFTWTRSDESTPEDIEQRDAGCCSVVYLTHRFVDGRFGPVFQISPFRIATEVNSLSVSGSGLTAIAGWRPDYGQGNSFLLVGRPGARPRAISGVKRLFDLHFAFFAGERGHLDWVVSRSRRRTFFDALRDPGGQVSRPRTLLQHPELSTYSVGGPLIRSDPRGNRIIVWSESRAQGGESQGRVVAATRTALGTVVKAQTLATAAYRLRDLALGPDGSAALLATGDDRLRLAVRPAGGRFGPLRPAPAGGRSYEDAFAAAGPGGRVAVLRQVDRGRRQAIEVLLGSVRVGVWSRVLLRSAPADDQLSPLAVGIDAAGRVTAVWTDDRGLRVSTSS
jgi:hypothetical protein